MSKDKTLGQILNEIGYNLNDLTSEHDQDKILISNFASIENATKTDITFLRSAKKESFLTNCKAGACFVPNDTKINGNGVALIKSDHPEYHFIRAANVLLNSSDTSKDEQNKESSQGYVASNAVIGKNVKIGKNVSISDFSIIRDNATIGDNCNIHEYCYIGKDCQIGNNCDIYSHTRIENSIIHNDVKINPGAKIGFTSFGFIRHENNFLTKPHIGKVVIHNSVEIGTNTVVDRGYLTNTEIGEGTRIGASITIGHNVKIGKHTIITAQTGIAGSVKIGNGVIIGGQVGIADHLSIEDGALICAKSGVSKTVTAGSKVMGYPAQDYKKFARALARLYRDKKK